MIFREGKKTIIFLHNINGLILFFMVALRLVLYHYYRKIYRFFRPAQLFISCNTATCFGPLTWPLSGCQI